MKLSSDDTKKLKDILAVCGLADIDSIIIESGIVRGLNENKTCAIISSNNIPAFSKKIGLSRISALRSRLELFESRDVEINAKESERGEISQLEITASKSKMQFRCTSTALIKAPSNINDELAFSLFITKDETKFILDAIRVMSAKNISLRINDNKAIFRISDVSSDSFAIDLENPISIESEEHEQDGCDYSCAVFSSVLRSAISGQDIIQIDIGRRGTARFTVLGHILTILPQISEEND